MGAERLVARQDGEQKPQARRFQIGRVEPVGLQCLDNIGRGDGDAVLRGRLLHRIGQTLGRLAGRVGRALAPEIGVDGGADRVELLEVDTWPSGIVPPR